MHALRKTVPVEKGISYDITWTSKTTCADGIGGRVDSSVPD